MEINNVLVFDLSNHKIAIKRNLIKCLGGKNENNETTIDTKFHYLSKF